VREPCGICGRAGAGLDRDPARQASDSASWRDFIFAFFAKRNLSSPPPRPARISVAVGRKLIDVPGYVFRVFVTNRSDAALEVWRDYNGRATVECRIAAHVQKLGRLFQTETVIQQPPTLASTNFSEVRSTNANRRMISRNFAPQFRNLGLTARSSPN
jgi:hypothetical protein